MKFPKLAAARKIIVRRSDPKEAETLLREAISVLEAEREQNYADDPLESPIYLRKRAINLLETALARLR